MVLLGGFYTFLTILTVLSLGITFVLFYLPKKEYDQPDSKNKMFAIGLVIFLAIQPLAIIPNIFGRLFYDDPILGLPFKLMSFLMIIVIVGTCFFAASIPRLASNKKMLIILVIVWSLIIPVFLAIIALYGGPLMEPTGADPLYWIFLWGLFCVFTYLIWGIGWKFGGGSMRQTFNITFALIWLQYSTLEDFIYYLPYTLMGYFKSIPDFLLFPHPALDNFLIPLSLIFGHPGTPINTIEMMIWCTIIIAISLFVLFDCPYLIYKKLKK